MTLFTSRQVLVFLAFILSPVWLSGQTCSPFPVFFPDTVCLGQTIQGLNQGPQANTYTWDLCAGDIFRPQPTQSRIFTQVSASYYGFKTISQGGKYYGFSVAPASASLIRLDFDTSINSVPTQTNLGNPGGLLSNPAGMTLQAEGNTVYGFVVNRVGDQVIRYTFSGGLTAAPTASAIPVTGLGNSTVISIIREGSNYWGFTYSLTSRRLIVLQFGNSLSNTPTILPGIAIGVFNITDIAPVIDCNSRILLCAENSAKVIRVNFGSSFSNATPVTQILPVTGALPGGVVALSLLEDGGRKLALLSGTGTSGIALANFGSGYENNPGLSPYISSPGDVCGISDVYTRPDGSSLFICLTMQGFVHRVVMPSGNCQSPEVTQYQPPPFVPASAGKLFVNYRVTLPTGESRLYGDSIVVKAAPSVDAVPVPAFVADEQCPSRPTRFFPQINPAGTYTYQWTFPGGTTSTLSNPSFQFSGTGEFPVRMVARSASGCATVSITRTIRIFPDPTVAITSNFSVPSQVCTLDSVLFSDGSGPQSAIRRWKWDFGGGQIVFSKNARAYFPFSLGGQTIQVSLTASDSSGCGTPVSKPVTLKAGANIQFSLSELCKGDQTLITNSTPSAPGIAFLWNFGDPASGAGNTSTSSAPSFTRQFSDTGLYSVSLRATVANGCTSRLTRPVRIFPLPAVDFTFPALLFPGQSAQFTNRSTALYQSLSTFSWNFGDPASGSLNTSVLTSPGHIYAASGSYPVSLQVKTNQNCLATRTKTLVVSDRCPVVSYTRQASSSGDFDTLRLENNGTGFQESLIDYCAGDLERVPIMQSQQTGAQPIASALQVVPVLDNGNWTGFIPAPTSINSTCFFKASIGTDFNNDISNFSTSLGTLQNRFPNPSFIRFYKQDSIWYAFAANADTKLWRIRFGTSLDNNSPVITEVNLPANTLFIPSSAFLVRDLDTTYLFITNNNNSVSNNFIRLRFAGSVEQDPDVFVLSNPLVMQNSTGFTGLTFARSCGDWYCFLIGQGQLYRLSFGKSLSAVPTAVSLNSEVNAALGSANAFNNLRGVNMVQDMGRWYGFVNTSTGTLIRIRFRGDLSLPPDQVVSLGSFGITGTVGNYHFVQQRSEFFAITINNAGTVYKFKFPNRCPATRSYSVLTAPGADSTVYREPGTYYITVTNVSPFGTRTQVLDSVQISGGNRPKSCLSTGLNHPDKICFDYTLQPSVQGGSYSGGEWDFCTGDFQLPPSLMAQPISATVVNAGGIQIIPFGGNYYAFAGNVNGISRINLGTSPDGTPGQPIPVTLPAGGASFNILTDFKIFKEGANWLALCIFQNGEGMLRLNFGPDLLNTNPAFAILNLPGFLARPRGLDVFEDKGSRYALISNGNSGSLTLLNFGSTYRNIPQALSIEVPASVNLYKVSVIRDCNIWHAFVSDQSQDSIYHLRFSQGLQLPPTRKMYFMKYGIGLKAIRDGNRFYLWATKVQPGFNNLFRFSFGRSLDETPLTDSLGNFPVSTPLTGMQRVIAFHLFQNDRSEYGLFGLGFDNGFLYRLKFQNPCSAEKPVARGDTVQGQIYRADGKYYFSWQGFDGRGELVNAFDSVIVQNLVDADFFIPGNRCKGQPVLFSDQSIAGTFTSITSWNWNFGDTLAAVDTSVLQNPVHTFSQAGSYAVRLRVREQGGCINEIVRTVVVAGKPRPDFTAGSGGLICTNDSIPFTNLSTSQNDPLVSHEWEVRKDGNLVASSQKKDPKFFFTQTGNYQVRLTVKGESQCDSSIVRNVAVGGNGSSVFFTGTPACLGEPATFTSAITGAAPDSIRWFIDAAAYPAGNVFSPTFTSTGVFSVRLTAYSGQCANTFTRIVNVNSRPQFSMGFQGTLLCQNLPVSFNSSLNTSDQVSYLWNFGDNTTDTVRAPVKIFSQPGTFSVVLRVTTGNGCDAEDTLSIAIRRAPKAMFSFDKACKDEPVQFTNQSTANGIPGGITSYLWEFGTVDNLQSNQKDPGPVFYNEPPGVKVVKLTVRTAEDCPNTFTLPITIGPKLAANYRKETGCIGTPFRFFDITDAGVDSIVSWNWSIGGLTYTSRNPVVEFDLKGTYDVRLKVSSRSGCIDEVVRTDDFTVLDPASADFSFAATPLTVPPFGYRVVFSQLPAPNPSYDYFWDFGDSTTSLSANPPPHFYTREGTYIVRLRAVRAGTICSTLVEKVVNLISKPVQGLKVRRITLPRGTDRISMSAEVENQSNIALRSFSMQVRAGNLVTQQETWTGILLPGAVIQYNFQSALLYKLSQPVPYVCITATLSDPSKETTPEDNRICANLDSVSSFIGIYPNPATREVTAELNLAGTDPLEIRMFNYLGQEVMRLEDSSPRPGPYFQTFDIRKLRAGLYTIWFRTGEIRQSRVLVVGDR